MRKSSIVFLQTVIIFVGIAVLALMLWEPHLEGRNANATLFQIYFNDPILAYIYTGSIAFFLALYQGYKMLGYAGKNMAFSAETAKSLRVIKYCALTIIAFVAGAEAYAWTFIRGKDDITGGVAIALLIVFISLVVAATMDVFEKLIQKINN